MLTVPSLRYGKKTQRFVQCGSETFARNYLDTIFIAQLVIHCGVHRSCDTIRLEEHAYNGSFCYPDNSNKCLPCKVVTLNSSKSTCDATTLSTKLDVGLIASELNTEVSGNCKFVASTEVGT